MSTLKFTEIQNDAHVDVAIIGAGISGLYCAYRMINSDEFKGKKIAIYDRLNRTGGRLQTDIIPVKEGETISTKEGCVIHEPEKIDFIKEEEGGMRFNYEMEELMTLNAELGICDDIVPFPMSSTGDTNRFCIRGHSFSVAEAKEGGNMIWSQLYDLNSEEIGLSPSQIVTNVYNRILEANDVVSVEEQTPEFWQKFRLEFTWSGIPMNEWQLWGLLRDMGYSEECIEMLTNTIGFAGPFKYLPNAGDAMQILADFPVDPTYYTFKNGFSTLPDTIIKALSNNENVAIYLSTNVDSINGIENDFSLTLTEAPEGENASTTVPGKVRKTIKANQIISAIASTGFKSLFIKSPALNTTTPTNNAQYLWESINGVLGMDLMKINFYFKQAWWYNQAMGRQPIEFGPNFTDLPINSIYPFYATDDLVVNKEAGTVAIKTGNEPAALTLYCDFNNTNFWKGLQNVGEKFTSPLQEKYNEKDAQTIYPASKAVVAEARKQMSALFGVTNIPEPIFTSYRLWNGEDDFEHAYHQWQLNVDDKKTIDYLANPLPGIYMCNEAISDMQGWVNGSLRSCNLALAKISTGAIQPLDNVSCKNAKSTVSNNTKAPLRISKGLWGA